MDSNSKNKLPDIAFILGMGRSGTTLLTNMLNSHPKVIATPENEFMLFSYSSFLKKRFDNETTIKAFLNLFSYNFSKIVSIWKPSADLKKDIYQLQDKTYANVCKLTYLNFPLAHKNKADVSYVIDKNPIYSLHIDKMNAIYPNSKYIVLVRDFRDNAVSRKKYGNTKDSIFMLAASWNYFYKQIFSSLKKHDINHINIRYEDLASNPENTLKTICSYLNIEYSESMLHFQEHIDKTKDYAKQNLSSEVFEKITEMHSNLYKDVNTNRVKSYEKELDTKEISILNFFCKEYGKKFNYIDDNSVLVTDSKFLWKLNFFFTNSKLNLYYNLKNLYFRLPVSLRLKFLKKKL